ncbi:MAG: RNA polymerase sigma factor [Butyricimonas faecihominis]
MDKIVDRCKKGDRKAGEQLYHMFSAKMFAVCIQYSKSREEAEDNLQDGFIKVLESIGQYKGKGSFEGWMKRIFINTALEKFRKNRSVQVVEEVPEVVDEDDVDDDGAYLPRCCSSLSTNYQRNTGWSSTCTSWKTCNTRR